MYILVCFTNFFPVPLLFFDLVAILFWNLWIGAVSYCSWCIDICLFWLPFCKCPRQSSVLFPFCCYSWLLYFNVANEISFFMKLIFFLTRTHFQYFWFNWTTFYSIFWYIFVNFIQVFICPIIVYYFLWMILLLILTSKFYTSIKWLFFLLLNVNFIPIFDCCTLVIFMLLILFIFYLNSKWFFKLYYP